MVREPREIAGQFKQPTLPATEEEWMAKHPLGFLEYREAFSANGTYGKWLRHHATVVEIGGVIFVHGGISSQFNNPVSGKINSQVQEEIGEFDKTRQDLVSRKVILPFFTTQEIAVAVQGELMAERAAESQRTRHTITVWCGFWVLTTGFACATMARYGFADTINWSERGRHPED